MALHITNHREVGVDSNDFKRNNVKNLRLIRIIFQAEIGLHELPLFRAAVIERAGREHLYFHNHLKNRDVRYGYPYIQYKQLYGCASIVAVGEGTEQIHQLFQKEQKPLQIGKRTIEMKIDELRFFEYQLEVANDKKLSYTIRNWFALNQKNTKIYNELTQDKEKNAFLKRVLIGNILAFAKGIDWQIDKPVEVFDLKIDRINRLTIKGVPVRAFCGEFTTNAKLPDFIGIGKTTSLGFGTIKNKKYKYLT